MTKKQTSKQDLALSRRRFIAGAGAGVMAAGAAVVASKGGEPVEQLAQVNPTDTAGKGYQLSEHVKTYYRTLLV